MPETDFDFVEISADERARLDALASFEMLDTPREQDFDEIADLASRICETPIAVVNLVGEGRQFFKAEVGLGVRETPLASSFCARAILEQDFMLILDATKDPRFDCNPLVTGEHGLRFYAGALLKTSDGHPIGTLCVLDYKPRDLTETQQVTLKVLARSGCASCPGPLNGPERTSNRIKPEGQCQCSPSWSSNIRTARAAPQAKTCSSWLRLLRSWSMTNPEQRIQDESNTFESERRVSDFMG